MKSVRDLIKEIIMVSNLQVHTYNPTLGASDQAKFCKGRLVYSYLAIFSLCYEVFTLF